MNGFPFIHQPEAVDFYFFTVLVKGEQTQKAFQLGSDHLQKRIGAAGGLSFIQGVTESIIVLFIHEVHFILFGVRIQRGVPRITPQRPSMAGRLSSEEPSLQERMENFVSGWICSRQERILRTRNGFSRRTPKKIYSFSKKCVWTFFQFEGTLTRLPFLVS